MPMNWVISTEWNDMKRRPKSIPTPRKSSSAGAPIASASTSTVKSGLRRTKAASASSMSVSNFMIATGVVSPYKGRENYAYFNLFP